MSETCPSGPAWTPCGRSRAGYFVGGATALAWRWCSRRATSRRSWPQLLELPYRLTGISKAEEADTVMSTNRPSSVPESKNEAQHCSSRCEPSSVPSYEWTASASTTSPPGSASLITVLTICCIPYGTRNAVLRHYSNRARHKFGANNALDWL